MESVGLESEDAFLADGMVPKGKLPKSIKDFTPAENYARKLQEILIQVAPFSLKWTTLFLETALANKSSILQIFLQSKFGINQTTDSKVRAKKLTFC